MRLHREIDNSDSKVAQHLSPHLNLRAGLEMPITNEVNAVLYNHKPARDAVSELMSRPLREEL